ncbi:hypothetical protein [Mycolicibacterium smegmatis]|uniref:hypothetical protein n=1 Tax=Mycolicibacterium smegmatis TaxID=1772 RepID=UPI0018EF097B|nr:hypothetical protein [Mycolicibacterium smegmatis]
MSEGKSFRRMNDRIDELITDSLIADDVRRYEAERQQDDRLAAIKGSSGTLSEAFTSGYREELREDWSAVLAEAAHMIAQRSAELNRRLNEE